MATSGPDRAGRTATLLSERIASLVLSPTNVDPLRLRADGPTISLAGGNPAPEAYPVDDIRAALEAVLTSDPGACLQYPPGPGVPEMREWVAARESARRGRPVAIEQVVITTGAQQGLDLLAKLIVDLGDQVVLDDPVYPGAVRAFEAYRPQLTGVPVDADGLDVPELASRQEAGATPKLVYTIPDVQNPTGATLSEDRRHQLAALADQHGFLLVEDDPFGALRFAGHNPPPLGALTESVVSIGSFSKIVAPGLRVGWVVLPLDLVPAFERLRYWADMGASALSQAVLVRLVAQPAWLDAQVGRLVGLYRERCDALLAAVRDHLADELSVLEPDGGFFLWARIRRPGLSATALLDACAARDLTFVLGSECAVEARHDEAIRLSFARTAPERFPEAARRMAAALDDLGRRP